MCMNRIVRVLLAAVFIWSSAASGQPAGFYYLQFQGQPQPTFTRAEVNGNTYLTGNFTVEAWVRLNGKPNGPGGMLCGQQSWGLDYEDGSRYDARRGWLPGGDPGGWSMFLRTDQGIVGTPPVALPENTWIHIAATYDGSVLRLLINGTEVASVPQTGSLAMWEETYNDVACQWGNFDLLAGISGGYGFYGNLRELAMWNKALTQEELAARVSFSLTGLEESLIHYWPLDDGENMARNLVPDGPAMILGNSPLDEGPWWFEPEWLLSDPFYEVREDWFDDLPGEDWVGLTSYAVSDFNRDGWDDFMFHGSRGERCNEQPSPFQVMLGNGTGRFEDGTDQVIEGPVPTPVSAFRSLLADFNGDEMPDFFSGNTGVDFCNGEVGWTDTLLLTNAEGKLVDASANLKGRPCTADVPQYPGQAPCYWGGVYGSREPGVRYPDPTLPLTTLPPGFTHSTAVGDFDDDGDLDIFVGNVPNNDLETPYFLVNDGSGNFEANWDAVPDDLKHGGVSVNNSAIADMDDDGFVDLLLCCNEAVTNPPDTPRVGGIYWGDGSGNYSTAPVTPFPFPRPDFIISTGGLLPIDFDGDGDKDLIVIYEPSELNVPANAPNATPTFIQTLVNQDNRQFVDETASRILTPSSLLMWIKEVFEIDFDANGCPDFLISHANLYHNDLFLNDCRGKFTAVNPAVLGKMRQLIPIDADGDGDLDFISYQSLGEWPPDFAILERLRPFNLSDLDPETIFGDGFE